MKKYLLILPIIAIAIFTITSGFNIKSPEFSIHSISPFNFKTGKIVAASCAFTGSGFLSNGTTGVGTGVGHADEYTACTTQINCNGIMVPKTGTSQCGGVCNPVDTNCPACPNGANNPPSCTTCPAGTNMVNGNCTCSNGATNPTSGCNICPNNAQMINGVCGCSNGATNPPSCNVCPAGTNMVNGNCTCSNGASALSGCTQCPNGQSLVNGQCVTPCNSTNACGQTIQGSIQNGQCVTSGNTNQYGYNDVNSSCIQTFNITTSSVYPNGSTEFSWTFPQLPAGVGRRCGFIDLSNPNSPKPIPGLQNLDSTTDRVRIQNIQRTTNFCLVCQFFDIATNRSRGEASAHNWVRVIRVGEN
jgi:hypothetical protein